MRKEYDFSKGKRGATVPPDPRKTQICIRIDTKTLNWFRQRVHEAGGGNYQTMINDALKDFIGRQSITKASMVTNVAETMVTNLAGSTTVSGTLACSTGIMSAISIGEVWTGTANAHAHIPGVWTAHTHIAGANKPDLMVKKEQDERKKYPLAA